jgi:hypothetical protein
MLAQGAQVSRIFGTATSAIKAYMRDSTGSFGNGERKCCEIEDCKVSGFAHGRESNRTISNKIYQ